MRKIKKVLVTGGAGFVGRHMTEALLRRGAAVRVMDNFSCSAEDSLSDLRRRIELIRADIRDSKSVRSAMKGVDVVYHFAAIRSVVRSVEDPFLSHEVNATGTLVLLEEARRRAVGQFLFASTSATYGAALAKSQKESGKLEPVSPYGMAKLLSEHYARYYFIQHGLPTTSFRIFNVYGPRQNPESKYSLVVPGVLARIFKHQPPVIDGTGEQARDFIYIDDVLEAFFRATGNKKSYGNVYNLGSGKACSVNALVGELLRGTGSSLRPVHGPRRPGDPDRTCADISSAMRDLGWRPSVPLRRGLENVIRDWKKNK